MQRLMERQGQTADPGSIRERTLVKLTNTVEEALAGIRQELLHMEQTVEQLKELLFQVEVFLADPSNSLRYAGTPAEALQHVSTLFDSYQSELLEKREVRFSPSSHNLLYGATFVNWLTIQHTGDGCVRRRRNLSGTVCSVLEGHARGSKRPRCQDGRLAQRHGRVVVVKSSRQTVRITFSIDLMRSLSLSYLSICRHCNRTSSMILSCWSARALVFFSELSPQPFPHFVTLGQ